MARKGNVNGGFEPDPETRSTQNVNRRQTAAYDRGCSSNGSVQTGVTGEAAVTLELSETMVSEVPVRWKEATTQTESSVTTVNWRILRTQPPGDADASCASVSSDYVVVETHALGHHVAVQTQDAHLFRYSEVDVVEMVIAWRMITLFIPTTWYLMLYVADQASTVAVIANLCHAGEQWWCGLTISFLVLPSLVLNTYAYGQ